MNTFDGDNITSLVQQSCGAELYEKASDSFNGRGHNTWCNCTDVQHDKT
jgi:hypothetical protein